MLNQVNIREELGRGVNLTKTVEVEVNVVRAPKAHEKGESQRSYVNGRYPVESKREKTIGIPEDAISASGLI